MHIGEYVLEVEARDEMGAGVFTDHTKIIIEIQSINSYRPVFIMPALSNASVELQEVRTRITYMLAFLFYIFQ